MRGGHEGWRKPRIGHRRQSRRACFVAGRGRIVDEWRAVGAAEGERVVSLDYTEGNVSQ